MVLQGLCRSAFASPSVHRPRRSRSHSLRSEQSYGTVRQEEVHCQEQPSGRPTRHQRGRGSQKKKSRPHNIIYELHCALRLSALVGIFRNAVKELIGSLRLTAEADLALESQSPVDDSSLLRMRCPRVLLRPWKVDLCRRKVGFQVMGSQAKVRNCPREFWQPCRVSGAGCYR